MTARVGQAKGNVPSVTHVQVDFRIDRIRCPVTTFANNHLAKANEDNGQSRNDQRAHVPVHGFVEAQDDVDLLDFQ